MKPILLIVVTEDWYFCSHRLPIARAARDHGYEVWLLAREGEHGKLIRAEGFTFVPWCLRRGGINPWHELLALIQLFRLYRRVRPTIVHHVAMKPVLYGSVAALLASVPYVVNAMAGLGFVFSSLHWKARIARPLIKRLFAALLRRSNSRLIVQNRDDAEMFVHEIGVEADRLALIRGSGVDIEHFRSLPEAEGKVTFTLVGRMLRDKGIYEYVDAVRSLRSKKLSFRALLVGDPDPENPASIDPDILRKWQRDGLVEWLGHRKDIAAIWAESHVGVLPSYREGLPKSLLEAAACGRPLIASDVPGCREIVRRGGNGFLVPPHSSEELAEAMEVLIQDSQMRRRMGRESRRMVEDEFSEEIVVRQTLELYQSLCGGVEP